MASGQKDKPMKKLLICIALLCGCICGASPNGLKEQEDRVKACVALCGVTGVSSYKVSTWGGWDCECRAEEKAEIATKK
jgi:hypothetical protein